MGMELRSEKRSGLLIFWKYRWFKGVIWGWAVRLAPILKPVSTGGSDLLSQRDIGICLGKFGGLE